MFSAQKSLSLFRRVYSQLKRESVWVAFDDKFMLTVTHMIFILLPLNMVFRGVVLIVGLTVGDAECSLAA